jgi:hypothetical protein
LSNNQVAAQALQIYIEKMSGAKLPIVEEGQPLRQAQGEPVEGKPAAQILVGHTQAAKKLGVKEPNMSVTVAPISSCVLHPNGHPSCWRRQESLDILTQWRRQTPHLMIYDYNPGMLLGMWVPERDVANFAVNAPMLKKLGIKGYAAEGRKVFMQTWISYYVRAKLLWDVKTNVAALKKDFYETFFGVQDKILGERGGGPASGRCGLPAKPMQRVPR